MADECCSPNGATPGVGAPVDEPEGFWRIRSVQLSAVSGILLAGGLLTSMVGAGRASLALFLAAAAVGGSTFVPESAVSLARGRVGVGTLMSIAAAGAVILGEVGEAASLAFLFSISEALEGYAMARTRRGLRALLSLVPERVLVRRDNGEVELDPAELQVGDVMVVRPGERLATDGVVRRGRSTLDISAITGESVPVEVDPGSAAFAASINGGGVLDVEVTARTSESSLARVVHIVEEAQERKGGSQRLAERIARPLVPGIMVIAAAVAVVGSLAGDPLVWIARSLVVLVAAAPCAFAISVPVTVVAAVGAAARMGGARKGRGGARGALRHTRRRLRQDGHADPQRTRRRKRRPRRRCRQGPGAANRRSVGGTQRESARRRDPRRRSDCTAGLGCQSGHRERHRRARGGQTGTPREAWFRSRR